VSGKIILVNGASSSGKTTLCRALQNQIEEPFWHFSIDHLRDAGVLPMERIRRGDFAWKDMRTSFFDGFHQSLPAFAGAGNNLLIEHILDTDSFWTQLQTLLQPFPVFFVGVHCPLPELERREKARGDRRIGDARRDIEILQIHQYGVYDIEIDSTNPLEQNVETILSAWRTHQHPSRFFQVNKNA
jgi:chloramphenicol 3-O phosphotransferase